jgi:hypothetical protein
MMDHILRGIPLRTRTDIYVDEGEGEDNIIFPRWTVHLLKIQVAPRHMPMNYVFLCDLCLCVWPIV